MGVADVDVVAGDGVLVDGEVVGDGGSRAADVCADVRAAGVRGELDVAGEDADVGENPQTMGGSGGV